VRFDVERGVSGFARNAAGNVFALAGCSVCLNKRTLDMQKKYAALRSLVSATIKTTIKTTKHYIFLRKIACEYTKK